MQLGIALLSAVIKAAVAHMPGGIRTVACTYDSCSSDDSWPRMT
jgi:hypothetical protein